MSSERPSASAKDADAAAAPASPPRSKKRPSRADDGDWSPNPSPRGSPAGKRRRTSAESAALALATVAAHASAAGARADAGRGPRSRPGRARVDDGHGAIRMLGAAAARVAAGRGAGRGAVKKQWSEADEFTLLNAAVAFRDEHGRVPGLPDTAYMFDAICDSISPYIDQAMVYYKLKRLKYKFEHSAGPHNRRLRDLCANLWGGGGGGVARSSEDESDVGERRAVPDAAAMMPVVTEVLGEYWKTNERAMAGVSLEKGLSLLGKKQGRSIETKWRKHLDEEMQTQMRRHDLAKEVCGLLTDAIKGLGP